MIFRPSCSRMIRLELWFKDKIDDITSASYKRKQEHRVLNGETLRKGIGSCNIQLKI